MTEKECKQLEPYFSKKEIEATGAKLEEVSFALFQRFVNFRKAIEIKIKLLHNGITTGNHKSEFHPKGEAVDFFLASSADPYWVFKQAVKAGFLGVGIYWNGEGYSFHLDLRKEPAFWFGVKSKKGDPWKFGRLIVDPKNELNFASSSVAGEG